MLKEYIYDRRVRLQDNPFNSVKVVIACLVIIFLGEVGWWLPMVICTGFYGLQYTSEGNDPSIYSLLPETEQERRKRLIYFSFYEALLLLIPVTSSFLILHCFSHSLMLQNLFDLLILETAYMTFLLHNMLSQGCRKRNTAKYCMQQLRRRQKGNRSNRWRKCYYGMVWLADCLQKSLLAMCVADIWLRRSGASFVDRETVSAAGAVFVVCILVEIVDSIQMLGDRDEH